jgi:aspartate/methionine/tyrosine aminotransferase
MSQILQFSDQHEIPSVVDEVYFKQVYPGVDYLSFGELTEDTPVVVLSGYINSY